MLSGRRKWIVSQNTREIGNRYSDGSIMKKIDHANVFVCHKTIQNVSQRGILSTMPSRNIVGKQQHRQR